MIRVLVAGTRSFGIACADALLQHPQVAVRGVVAPHDDSLAAWAGFRGIHVGPAVTEALVRDADVDVIVGAHCHSYIGKKSRRAARLGALIGHPSLLPRHRGKSAVEWTVRHRDTAAGFSWFWADSGVDTGPVVLQDFCLVNPAWSASDLWREELFPMGVRTVGRAVELAAEGHPGRPQDPRLATWEPSLEDVPNLHRTELLALPAKPWTSKVDVWTREGNTR